MVPLVSICTTTYNHKAYLEGAIRSFLCQKCSFPYEILVHDDCSTDGTTDLLRKLAAEFPDIILPLYEKTNQYSQNIPINETFNFPRARGKYIALCEGDDYWLCTDKLQRQIDALETHPECTFSFTNAIIHDESGMREDRVFLPYYEQERPFLPDRDAVMNLSEVASLSFIPTASFVFRTDTLRNLPAAFTDKMCQHGDLKMKLFLTAAGNAFYVNMNSCLYRENVAGSAFQVWKKEKRSQLYKRCKTVVEMLEDVDEYSRHQAHEALWMQRNHYLNVMAHNAPSLKQLFQGDLGRYFSTLPAKEKLLCTGRLVMPQKLSQSLSALRHRKISPSNQKG